MPSQMEKGGQQKAVGNPGATATGRQTPIPTELDKVPDVKLNNLTFAFDGAWLPSVDPTLIGPKNFQRLINMRYNDGGIEGINGYTEYNTTAITDYTTIANGIHFRTNRSNDSYVLVHAIDPDTGQGRVYQNQTAIGSQGDFEATHLHADASVDLVGRFSQAPSGAIAYCNGEESLIWSGEEGPIGAVFQTQDASDTNPKDKSEEVANSRDESGERITIDTADYDFIIIMTTRPVKGFKFYVSSSNPNGAASAFGDNGKYWDGSSWAALGNITDNTVSGGAALAQTGTITFDDTLGSAVPYHFQERFLYAYQFQLDAGDADVYEITADYGMQVPSNVWDGVYRTPIQAQFYNDSDDAYEDYTLHVSESSSMSTPVGMIIDGMTVDDRIYIMFEEQMSAIRFTMLGSLLNINNAQITANTMFKYWNGTAFTAVGATVVDGTLDDTADSSFAKSGLISWEPPSAEEKREMFGTIGYVYEIAVDATLSGTEGGAEDVVIDLISGIPAQKDIEVYKFPVQFKSKLMLCGYTQGNEGQRIDFSIDNAPDVFNGADSSMDGYQSLYVGGVEALSAACQLYNRFGSNILATLTIFKNNELYLLTGSGPLDYKLYPISFTVGCPAPLTLSTAEVGFELGNEIQRNVAMWISHGGPMLFDGAILRPIRGLEKYFDPNESVCINFDQIGLSRGWFDSTYKEYNILIPSGTGQTSLNAWFCYDIVRKKWFQKDTQTADFVQSGWPCVATNGDQYVYSGTLVGTVMQLEDGANWNGDQITNTIQTGDFFPSGSEWDITRIRRVKFVCKRIDESGATAYMRYYANTDDDGGVSVVFRDVTAARSNSGNAGVSFVDVTASISNSGDAGVSFYSPAAANIDLTINTGLNRVIRQTNNLNQEAWCHSITWEFSTTQTGKGLQPIGWGIQWERVRDDINDL